MHLYDVKIAHPSDGECNRVIASEKGPEQVVEKMTALGLEVIEINGRAKPDAEVTATIEPPAAPTVDPVKTEPEKVEPTGRVYGRSAQGPRRNATEMAEDRRIEELAAALGQDIASAGGVRVATELLAELEVLADEKE